MTLFKMGEFKSHSDIILSWKIDCDDLTEEDWKCLALITSEIVSFGAVEGVPRGGIPFADALVPYITKGPLLIVDDVLTTGGSMEEHRAGRDTIGMVVFSRDLHKAPLWIRALFKYC